MSNFWGQFSSGFGSGFQMGRQAIRDAAALKAQQEEREWLAKQREREEARWGDFEALATLPEAERPAAAEDLYTKYGDYDKAVGLRTNMLQQEATGLNIASLKDAQTQRRGLMDAQTQNSNELQGVEDYRLAGGLDNYIRNNVDTSNLAPGQTVEGLTASVKQAGGPALGLLEGPMARIQAGFNNARRLAGYDRQQAQAVYNSTKEEAAGIFANALMSGDTKMINQVMNVFPDGTDYRNVKVSKGKDGVSMIEGEVGSGGEFRKVKTPLAEFLLQAANRFQSPTLAATADTLLKQEDRVIDRQIAREGLAIQRMNADTSRMNAVTSRQIGGAYNRPNAFGTDADGTPVFQQGLTLVRADGKPIADYTKVRREAAARPPNTIADMDKAEDLLRKRYPNFDTMPASKQDELRATILGGSDPTNTMDFSPTGIEAFTNPPVPTGATPIPPAEVPWSASSLPGLSGSAEEFVRRFDRPAPQPQLRQVDPSFRRNGLPLR